MRLPPMIASLTRHKLTVLLMLLACAFTCAIVTNIASMIASRVALLTAPSGLDESSVVVMDSALIHASRFGSSDVQRNFWGRYEADLHALRGIPGVTAAAAVSGLPMLGGASFGITATADAPSSQAVYPSAFSGGPGTLQTLGLELVQGRDFVASDYVTGGQARPSAAIISRSLAKRLFHTRNAVGRLFYRSGQPVHVVGIVAHLMNMYPELGATDNEYAMLLPVKTDTGYVTFVLHTAPANRNRVLQHAVTLLNKRDPRRIIANATTFSHVRAEHFRRESSMLGLLLATAIGLLLVTAAGIAGLASFWVQQRTRSIGIRRALGATRADILRYTHVENFLIVTAGVMLGCGLAYGLNLLLMAYYALQVLPPAYLAIGAVALWLMGQLAVLAPSLHAGAVPPAVATRSV